MKTYTYICTLLGCTCTTHNKSKKAAKLSLCRRLSVPANSLTLIGINL
ncbi:MAG: hypothetical protein WC441_05450 [Patescibacteria group bacterium]